MVVKMFQPQFDTSSTCQKHCGWNRWIWACSSVTRH